MKPTSIIFLVVAVVLAGAGLLTCVFAERAAEADGIQIYAATVDENDNAVYAEEFGDKGITKIEVLVSDADVNIIGGAEVSRIELVNFNEGMYTFGMTGKIISVNETPDIVSMLKFWENGLNFNGIRYFVRFGVDAKEGKCVNIYLTSSEAVKKFDIATTNGNVTIKSISLQSDYIVDCKGGKIITESMNTASSAMFTGDVCDIEINSSRISNLTAKIDEGDVAATQFLATTVDVEIKTGDMLIDLRRDITKYSYELSVGSGTVTVGGSKKGEEYIESSANENIYVKAKVGEGVISVEQSATVGQDNATGGVTQ